MGKMDRDIGGEGTRGRAGQEGQSRPSLENLLTAFREVSQRRSSARQRNAEPGPPSQLDPEENGPGEKPLPPEQEPGSVPEPELRFSRSPVETIEATIAAFRKARRREAEFPTWEPSAEEPAPTERPRRSGRQGVAKRSEEEPGTETEPRPEEGPGGPDGTEREAEKSESGSAEDLAPAFRQALSERDRPEPADSEKALEEEVPEEQASEQGGHGGEGPPPPPAGSSRPEASYLWVTDRPPGEQRGAEVMGERSATVSVERLSGERAAEAEAFLLRGGGERPYRLLKRIRGHPDPAVYLKPVFWRHEEGAQSPVSKHVDGEWTSEEGVGTLRETAAEINRRIEAVMKAGEVGEGGVELRVLRFMATRNHQFAPQWTVENSDGFVYPKLTPLLERESRSGGGELSRILSTLDERRLLTGEFVMRQHACRNCGCAFLNFEEMCPHCGSTDLDTDDLVHHFRCAFTGALSEYKKEEGKLVCPKCDRHLKQIGVDYDKPSVVHSCQRCHEEFQNPEVQTTCYRCEHTNPPEQQVKRQIKKYETTALGEETAIYGLSDSLLSILERESRLLDYATFQLIVESEAARIERYQRSTSTLLLVRVTKLRKLRMELGERSQEVIEEIATAFDNTLRSSDYLSARDESLYLFLLTETDQDGARRAGERLEENIEGVLRQNLSHPPELSIAVQPLRPGIDLDSLADRFLTSRPATPARATDTDHGADDIPPLPHDSSERARGDGLEPAA